MVRTRLVFAKTVTYMIIYSITTIVVVIVGIGHIFEILHIRRQPYNEFHHLESVNMRRCFTLVK